MQIKFAADGEAHSKISRKSLKEKNGAKGGTRTPMGVSVERRGNGTGRGNQQMRSLEQLRTSTILTSTASSKRATQTQAALGPPF